MRDLLRVRVGFRAVNVTGRVGSGRAVSNDFGFGPGSGFSLKPVQTSTYSSCGDEGNELLNPIRNAESMTIFKRHLKTHLFRLHLTSAPSKKKIIKKIPFALFP